MRSEKTISRKVNEKERRRRKRKKKGGEEEEDGRNGKEKPKITKMKTS